MSLSKKSLIFTSVFCTDGLRAYRPLILIKILYKEQKGKRIKRYSHVPMCMERERERETRKKIHSKQQK